MHVVCGRGSSCFGGVVTLCASGFVDDVIFVHNRRGKGDTSLTEFDVFDGLVLDRVANIRRVPKKRHETRSRNSVSSQPIFEIFSPSDSAINLQQSFLLKIPPHVICVATLPRETNINVRK